MYASRSLVCFFSFSLRLSSFKTAISGGRAHYSAGSAVLVGPAGDVPTPQAAFAFDDHQLRRGDCAECLSALRAPQEAVGGK